MNRFFFFVFQRKIEESERLRCLDELIYPDGSETKTLIQEADPVTLTLRAVCVGEEYDSDGNDLLIRTRYGLGRSELVERLHYCETNIEVGRWLGDFFNDIVFSVQDFQENAITIECLISEFKSSKLDDENTPNIFNAVRAASQSASVMFPLIGTWFGLATSALDLGAAIRDLGGVEEVMKQRLRLTRAKPKHATSVLQEGYYVCIQDHSKERRNPREWNLNRQLRLVTANQEEIKEISYAVYEIHKVFEKTGNWEVDGNVAQMAAILSKKNSGGAALDRMKSAMTGFLKYQRLDRAAELLNKPIRTPSEERLLNEFLADPQLRPFLEKLKS